MVVYWELPRTGSSYKKRLHNMIMMTTVAYSLELHWFL